MSVKKRIIISILILFCLCQNQIEAQVTITGAQVNSLNVTPGSLSAVSVMNTAGDMQVVLQAKITNSSNEILISIQTNPILLHQGLNLLGATSTTINSIVYGASAQANQVQTMHVLPSGNYQYCCAVIGISSEGGDDYCEEMESDIVSNMFLINPDHLDTIETVNPLLMWGHSEPFNMLASGESFKMTVVELNANQSADNGIQVNSPIFVKNNLNTHSLLYPIDAPELAKGKRYGWQVQKICNGVVTNSTEAWEFIIKKEENAGGSVYGVLKKKLDANYYVAKNNKLFFRFREDYIGGDLVCRIYNSKREPITPIVKNNDNRIQLSKKTVGYNYFEIDLALLNISQGYYTLEVTDERKEVYLLRFYIE